MRQVITISRDTVRKNKNHHICKNGHSTGVFWCHFTTIVDDNRKERIRFSLKTKDINEARACRDSIIKDIERKGLLKWT